MKGVAVTIAATIMDLTLPWIIGLAPALLIRYVILKRVLSKRSSIIITIASWFLGIFLLTSTEYKNMFLPYIIFVPYIAAWPSLIILHGTSKNNK